MYLCFLVTVRYLFVKRGWDKTEKIMNESDYIQSSHEWVRLFNFVKFFFSQLFVFSTVHYFMSHPSYA